MKVLTLKQKRFYEDEGYLFLPALIDAAWLDRIDVMVAAFIERSRAMAQSDATLLLEPGHTAGQPRLRRIPNTVAHDPVFAEFGLAGPIVDLAEDMLGPDIRFHHSKLNFKWQSGGEPIEWHQDIPFWPHTNYSPLTIGVYLADVDDAMGPMGVYAGSHHGPISRLRDAGGAWTGQLAADEIAGLDPDRLRWLGGPRGSVTVHNCRTVHGSFANRSPRMRPLLLHTYAAADALPLTRIMDGVPHATEVIRGNEPSHARFDLEPCPLPPAWEKTGYSSIFTAQGKADG